MGWRSNLIKAGWHAGVLVLLACLAIPADAKVSRYFASINYRGEMKLVGVTATRGNRDVTFDATKLIRVEVVHFKSNDATSLAVVGGTSPPPVGQRARLLGDNLLNTGLLNPGGQQRHLSHSPILEGPNATPGMAVVFQRPVVNLRGDDIVLFELHTKANSPLGGDAFRVSPLKFESGLHAITIEKFDITLDDPHALPLAGFDLYRLARAPRDLADLESSSVAKGNGASLESFKALAIGIDLSALGYAEGRAVEGLFFQDKSGTGLQVDPVLIAGLPSDDPSHLLGAIPKKLLSRPGAGELLQTMLAGPMAGVREIVFAERVCGFDHWYANFGQYAATVSEYPPQRGTPDERIPVCFGNGGRLCRLNLKTGQRTVLLDDPDGGIRDPQVHYDAKKILFSYREGGRPYYHLYEINVDGTQLVRLTDGPSDDIEPTYLPDGGIMFCSSRCKRYVNCHRTPVATLYRCDADGGNTRMISCNVEHDNTPWMLPDGRVLYMRWEYVDRSQFCFHHLWTTNPDGRDQMIYFGNQFPGIVMLDAKPIPKMNKIVASFSPGHGVPGHMGHITVVDPDTGPDNFAAAKRVSRGGHLFRDPYPLSEGCFLVADNRGIHVMDGRGNTDTIYQSAGQEPRLTCHEPRPLIPRVREPVVPSRIDPTQRTGRFVLTNIYEGRDMAGVQRGEIKKLLVLEQLPKPINFSGGMWPTSAGGTFTLSRILGTVPVTPDGSVHMEVPALRSLLFVALDANNLSVKRMQSFVSVQPGETLGCVGCHERRTQTPLPGESVLACLKRPPSRIEPIADVPDVIDYPRDIQPILDQHCVACHNSDRSEGHIDLCGDHTPLFSVSYWNMLQHALISDGRNERYGNRPPRTIGSSASRLLQLVDGTHYDARLTERQQTILRLWIDSSAVYAGTYAALGSGMYPVRFPVDVMQRRCGKCHGEKAPKKQIGTGMYFRFGTEGPALPLVDRFTELQQIRGSIGYYKFGNARPPQSLCNLTRPEKSLLLLAPLARERGGLGWCRSAVLLDTRDPDYQAILARIQAAAKRHLVEKRFDMTGFRPNIYYFRKMQTYGILPADLDPNRPIDIYATDRKYWKSFWYQSPTGKKESLKR